MPKLAHELAVLLRLGDERLEIDHRGVAPAREPSVDIEHIRDPARHAGREVSPGDAEDDDRAAGHVLTAVVANALDHGVRAGIAHREALPRYAAEVRAAGDGAVQHHVAGDDVLRRLAAELRARLHADSAAGEPLAAVVVGVADQVQPNALREEGAEALPSGASEANVDGLVGETVVPIAPRDLVREHRADRAIDVADRHLDRHLLAALDRRAGELDQTVVERLVEPVVLLLAAVHRHLGRHLRHVEHLREVEPLRLPVLDALAHVEEIGAADQLVQLPRAEPGHQLAYLLRDEEEIVDDVLRPAFELLAQHRILGRDADRTGVQVALAHHDAALDNERRGSEAELINAEHRADHDVTTGLHLTIDLHRDPAAKPIEH